MNAIIGSRDVVIVCVRWRRQRQAY